MHAELAAIAPNLPQALAQAERDFVSTIKLDPGVDPAVLARTPEMTKLGLLQEQLTELGYFGGTGRRVGKPGAAQKTTA